MIDLLTVLRSTFATTKSGSTGDLELTLPGGVRSSLHGTAWTSSQVDRSNMARDFANENVAEAKVEAEGLVNHTTKFLNEAVDLTPLGKTKLAKEWDKEQTRAMSK